MSRLTVEEQVAVLRRTTGFAAHMHRWLMAGAAIGVVTAVVLWHPVPLMIGLFLGVVAYGEQEAGPNIVRAIAAYDSGTPVPGEVSVAITSWDTDNHYHATVRARGQPDWKYEFIAHGWQPSAGSYPARIWRAGANGRPILAVVEQGILIPRKTPERVPARPAPG